MLGRQTQQSREGADSGGRGAVSNPGVTGQIPRGGARSPVGPLARSSASDPEADRPSSRQGAPSSQHTDVPLYPLTSRSAPAHTYSREGRAASGGCRGGFPGGSSLQRHPRASALPLTSSQQRSVGQSPSDISRPHPAPLTRRPL